MKTKGRQNRKKRNDNCMQSRCMQRTKNQIHKKQRNCRSISLHKRSVLFFCLIRHLLIEHDRSFFATLFAMHRKTKRMKFDIGNCKTNRVVVHLATVRSDNLMKKVTIHFVFLYFVPQ